MFDKPMASKKVAILVESQYIPSEIATYRERFASYGAEVHLMSRLWGQSKQTFVSEVEDTGKTPETLEVNIDIDQVNPENYAAVIIAANYVSVRLRWNEAAVTSSNAAEIARNAPAVRFFRRAMRNRDIIKGAPCHGLWLMTPSPDYLAGRRVTCNPVVLADVVNAGAFYVSAPPDSDWYRHVVTDVDLVTSMSATNGGSEAFVDAVRDAILQLRAVEVRPEPAPQCR